MEASGGRTYVEIESAARCRLKTYRLLGSEEDRCLVTFLQNVKDPTSKVIDHSLTGNSAIKVNIFMLATFKKPLTENPNDFEFCKKNFKTKNIAIFQSSKDDHLITEIVEGMFEKIKTEKSQCDLKGSNWIFSHVDWIELRVNKYNPLKGKCCLEIPESIKGKNAVINVKNRDEFCFKYAVWTPRLKSMKHRERVSAYRSDSEFEKGYNWNCIKYPVALHEISEFERVNKISINVFGVGDNGTIEPLKTVKEELSDHRDLLYLENDESQSHYAYITDFARLVSRQISTRQHKIIICKKCFKTYDARHKGEEKLKEHKILCNKNEYVRVEMPKKGEELKFKTYFHSQQIEFVIYADFESVLKPVEGPARDKNQSYSKPYQLHEVAAYGYFIKDKFNKFNVYRSHRAEKDVVAHFLNSLKSDFTTIEEYYNRNVKMGEMTEEEKINHANASKCYMCGGNGFDSKDKAKTKVADHCHRTSKYRGPAHAGCNINFKHSKFVPIFIHNLSGYDSHFIIRELGCIEGAINVIPETTEKYISFSKTIGKLEARFLDSYRFMSSTLSKLASNLQKEHFRITKAQYPNDEHFNLLTKKGVYPYDYITSYDKFEERSLPGIESFYNQITDSSVTDEEYAHALKVWNTLNIEDLGGYTDIYLKTDVLILADVFENFRNICLKIYSLDPAWYYTAPGLAWSAMLKYTGITLELISDYDMFLMLENGKRGGLCQSIKRYACANNKYLDDYDETKPSTFITYLDANNLYGWAMQKNLPYGNFKWMSEEEIGALSIEDIADDGEMGYILDVDISYPQSLHSKHTDLPYCPELRSAPGTDIKLLTTLYDKHNYVAHYSLLKQALKAGLIIQKINRGISFSQRAWLKPYIELNTNKRKLAKTDFEKDFYKLMNNSVFGKTMENIRNRTKVELVSDEKTLEKLISKPSFKDRTILVNKENGEFLIQCHMDITKLTFNKPIYAGVSILDISKTLMYEFYYDIIKPRYQENVRILYMDTDSFFYETETEDWYEDMKDYLSVLDTSDYPKNHSLYSDENKKSLGKFKDEMNGRIIREFVALRPKMYAFRTESGEETKKAKGISKVVIKNDLNFQLYKSSLFENVEMRNPMKTMRSREHIMCSMEINKISLSPHDDKRKILKDNVHTVPYGFENDDDLPPAKRSRTDLKMD